MQAKYVNPFTDFGFKKIFGEEASKPLLIDFLNALLPLREKIVSLSFKNSEQLGLTELDRKAVYDIYCESENGEKFIVELQKAKQNYFVDRTIYYSTFPIREQADKGFWNYNLKAVFCVGILDFTFDDYQSEPERKEVVHTVQLKNQHCKVFYDKLTYIYLEMPNFNKQENELATRLDKWLYFIQNLEDFQSIPAIFSDTVFVQAFETAELAKFDDAERAGYERSLKIARDNKNTFDYAMEQVVKEANERIAEADEKVAKADEKIAEANKKVVKAEEDARKAEEDVRKAEEDVRKAEEDVRKAEEDVRKAEEETRRAEEEAKSAEEEARKAVQETTIKVKLEEKAQVVRTARQMGLSVQAISQLTGLTEEEINNIN